MLALWMPERWADGFVQAMTRILPCWFRTLPSQAIVPHCHGSASWIFQPGNDLASLSAVRANIEKVDSTGGEADRADFDQKVVSGSKIDLSWLIQWAKTLALSVEVRVTGQSSRSPGTIGSDTANVRRPNLLRCNLQ